METMSTPLSGCVKWFDNGLNYGFITVLTEGEYHNKDIFVHQSNIRTKQDCYRTLYTGECVAFEVAKSDNATHPIHAVNVSGFNCGLLHCENPTFRARQGFRGGRGGVSRGQGFRRGGDRGGDNGEHRGRDNGGYRGGYRGGDRGGDRGGNRSDNDQFSRERLSRPFNSYVQRSPSYAMTNDTVENHVDNNITVENVLVETGSHSIEQLNISNVNDPVENTTPRPSGRGRGRGRRTTNA